MTTKLANDGLHMADNAFLMVGGSTAERVRAAVWAYLWGQENIRELFGMSVYPSRDELKAALADAGFQLT